MLAVVVVVVLVTRLVLVVVEAVALERYQVAEQTELQTLEEEVVAMEIVAVQVEQAALA
jgi:hypothetical protein